MAPEMLRDSTFGQILNWASDGKLLQYPEQRPGFVVPSRYLTSNGTTRAPSLRTLVDQDPSPDSKKKTPPPSGTITPIEGLAVPERALSKSDTLRSSDQPVRGIVPDAASICTAIKEKEMCTLRHHPLSNDALEGGNEVCEILRSATHALFTAFRHLGSHLLTRLDTVFPSF